MGALNVYDLGARPDNPAALAGNTAYFQKALDSAKRVVVPAGEWHVGALVGANGVRFEAESPASVLSFAGTGHLLDFSGKSDWEVNGFSARGSAAVSYATFYPTVVDLGQGFLKISWADRFIVSGLRLDRFAGTAIVYENSGSWEGRRGFVRDVLVRESFKALLTQGRGEYTHFTHMVADRCTFGFHKDSGNNPFTSCQANYCGVAMKISGGENHGHSSNVGCTFNHNNYNLDVWDGVFLGESFVGCNFIGGIEGCGDAKIRIYNSTGVNITGGQIVSKIIVDGGSGSASGMNQIAGNFMRDCPAPSIVNGGLVRLKENFDSNGAWAYNN